MKCWMKVRDNKNLTDPNLLLRKLSLNYELIRPSGFSVFDSWQIFSSFYFLYKAMLSYAGICLSTSTRHVSLKTRSWETVKAQL